MSAPDENILRGFEAFCAQANALSTQRYSRDIEAFSEFVDKARQVIIDPKRNQLNEIASTLGQINAVILPGRLDILSTAGLTLAEDPYTELMAWALSPAVDETTAMSLQRAWLTSLGISAIESTSMPATPRTQIRTDDGIPDLVLAYPEFLVVVEAKTGSAEHTTPGSGDFQTHSYPAAVRRRLMLPDSHPTHVVFLTPRGDAARNADAIPATYFQFGATMARVLHSVDPEPQLRILYSLIATHFCTRGIPADVDSRAAMAALTDSPDDAALLANLKSLDQITRLIGDFDGVKTTGV